MFPLFLLALAANPQPERVPAKPLTPEQAARREALIRYGIGLLRESTDRPAEAVRHLEAAAKSAPESSAPLRPLVKLYTDLGREAAAIRTARKILELDPTDADTAHTLAKLLVEANRYPEAVKLLRSATASPRLAGRPAKKLGILRDLARVAELAGDFPTAEDASREAIAYAETERKSLLKSANFPTPEDLDREIAGFQEQLAKSQVGRKQYPEAARAYTDAAKRYEQAGDRAAAARLSWNLSEVLAEKGETAAALEQLQKFLALKPSGSAPYERYAALMHKLGRSGEAARELGRMARENRTNSTIFWVAAYAAGQADAARDTAFRELATRTPEPAAYRLAVRHFRESNQPAELVALLDILMQAARTKTADEAPASQTPASDPAAVARARGLADAIKSDLAASRMLVRHLPRLQPANLGRETWEFLAALAERDGKLADAETALRQSLGANPTRETVSHLLEILAKQRKWAALRDECQKLIRGSGKQFPVMYQVYLATALAEIGGEGNAAGAVQIAEELASIDLTSGDRLWGKLHKPRILNILGRHAEAVTACEKLLKEFRKPGEIRRIRILLADSLNGQKEFAKAEAELRAILEDDPDDMTILNNLGYNLADQGRKLPEAEEMIRRAIELDTDERARNGNVEAESGVYLDSLGWVLFRRGKLDAAREIFEKAVACPDSAGDAVVWDHLGDVAFRQGDKDRARTAWSKAVDLFSNSHTGRQAGRRDETIRKLKRVP